MSLNTTHNACDSLGMSLVYLILGLIFYSAPSTVLAQTPEQVLTVAGSNTLGARLLPELLSGLFAQQGYRDIRVSASSIANEQWVSATTETGQLVQAHIAAHGTGTGFSALAEGQVDIAGASRPVKASEAEQLKSFMDAHSPQAEHVIALDGVAVIVHPQNPLTQLSTEQLARLFSGQISHWHELGGAHLPVTLYARDQHSGTFDTFKELVLSPYRAQLSASATRFESSSELAQHVSRDPSAIGFIGLPYIAANKALAIADGESFAMPAQTSLIATEDYPLSRRLFLYLNPQQPNPMAHALIEYAQSAKGQALVEKAGFVAQKIEALSVKADPQMPEAYQQLANQAKRLSVNFRFSEGSAQLDNKALRDVERLLDYLRHQRKMYRKAVLVGFGDVKNDSERAQLLSQLRAMALRRELAREGFLAKDILGLGQHNPVASNNADEGRIRNRRVEVWVY